MRGIVVMLNARIDRVAVDAGEGNFTVADLQGDSLSVGDVVIGDLDSHGGCTWHVEGQSRNVSVYVEVIQATRASAKLHVQVR